MENDCLVGTDRFSFWGCENVFELDSGEAVQHCECTKCHYW